MDQTIIENGKKTKGKKKVKKVKKGKKKVAKKKKSKSTDKSIMVNESKDDVEVLLKKSKSIDKSLIENENKDLI